MPRLSKFVLLFFVGLVVAPVFATDFKAPAKAPQTNLIRENEALTVLIEDTVQIQKDDSRRVYALLATSISAERLIIHANENKVRYPLESARGAVGAQWGYLPFQFYGYFGILGTVHYTYLEQAQEYKTALHWMTVDLHAIYRYEPTRRTLLKPFFGLGGGSQIFIQRGPTGYDTSEAQGVASGILGVAWNLTSTFKVRTPLLWELTLQYKRINGPEEERMNLDGEHYSVGMELAL